MSNLVFLGTNIKPFFAADENDLNHMIIIIQLKLRNRAHYKHLQELENVCICIASILVKNELCKTWSVTETGSDVGFIPAPHRLDDDFKFSYFIMSSYSAKSGIVWMVHIRAGKIATSNQVIKHGSTKNEY